MEGLPSGGQGSVLGEMMCELMSEDGIRIPGVGTANAKSIEPGEYEGLKRGQQGETGMVGTGRQV